LIAVRFKISNLKTDDDNLIAIHKLLFKRPGTVRMLTTNQGQLLPQALAAQHKMCM
jgi:hypothetical protein